MLLSCFSRRTTTLSSRNSAAGELNTGSTAAKSSKHRTTGKVVGAMLGEAVKSGIRGASLAIENLLDDVSLAVSTSLHEHPLALALGGKKRDSVREPIRVAVRLHPQRPPLGKRSARLSCAHGAVRVRGTVRGASPATFQMDALFEEAATQETAYLHGVGTLIPRLLAGRKCAVLFLGQSGSGKTHTAFGTHAVLRDFRARGEEEWGAAPRASRQLFDRLGVAIGAAGPIELSVSWYEVRGKRVVDLLRMDDAGVEAEASATDSGRAVDGRAFSTSAADDDSNGAKKQQRAARAAERSAHPRVHSIWRLCSRRAPCARRAA